MCYCCCGEWTVLNDQKKDRSKYFKSTLIWMINLQLQKKIVFIVKKLLLHYRSNVCLRSVDAAAARSY